METSTPENIFDSAAAKLLAAKEAYIRPSWIRPGDKKIVGPEDYWINEKGKIVFDPDLYDPAQPYIPKGNLWVPAQNQERLLEDPFDLANLRIMDAEKVRALLGHLEYLAQAEDGREIVCMMAMGGTIAMKKNSKGQYEPGINADELLKLAGGGLDKDFAVGTIDFPTLIDSSQMEMDYAAELVIAMGWIRKNASNKLKKRFGGFIIPHGTDTLATSSAYTDMMLGPNVPFPVVFVGAQKTPENQPYTDVPTNIQNAFRTLKYLHKESKNLVVIYGGGTSGGAYSAAGSAKRSDSSVSAVDAPYHGKVIDADVFGTTGFNFPFHCDYYERRKKYAVELEGSTTEFKPLILRGYSPILTLRPDMGEDPQIYYDFIRSATRAKIVHAVTFGSFTLNNKLARAVTEAAKDSGKRVLAANPFPEGSTNHRYQVADQLRATGVTAINIHPIMVGVKAAAASALLGEHLDEQVRFIADRNVVGELAPKQTEARRKRAGERDRLRMGMPAELLQAIHQGRIQLAA